MFKKSTTSVDIRKSQQKCVDLKRDTPTRLKHLKAVLENSDLVETKNFLEANFSVVFYLFYDSFIAAEYNLRQKGAFAVQRNHREELEHCLFFLDRILCLLPELVQQRWQCNSFTHIFKKLLHPNNTIRLKREAMRLFLIWYMIVGENRSEEMDCMFASLVDGFPVPPPPVHQIDSRGSKVTWIEPMPIIAQSNTEKNPDDISAYMLRYMLDFMVSQVRRVEWREKSAEHPKSFSFVFGRFRRIYLPYIFPNFNPKNSIYQPNLDLPELRTTPGLSPFGSCPLVLVDWVKKYISPLPKKLESTQRSNSACDEEGGRRSAGHTEQSQESQGSASDQDSVLSAAYCTNDEASVIEDLKLVQDILFTSRENVDFIHEVFRQTLRLCFRYSVAMKTVIQCYSDWIKMAASDLPLFMLEPNEFGGSRSVTEPDGDIGRRLRSDSYIGAISSDVHVRAGLQNVLQVFVTSAANVFLLIVSPDYARLLDEQVDLCKLVLNIYRYMVMNSRMEQKTWEQLLVVLFHITSQTLTLKSQKHKGDSLGRRFSAALFQTLIVSWIKANLSVVISGQLWDQLLSTLSSLTYWEELIKEWAKTMDTLTKVLARHVYDLELNNLPLDRLTERKALKKGGPKSENNQNSWNANKTSVPNQRPNANVTASHLHSVVDGDRLRRNSDNQCRDGFWSSNSQKSDVYRSSYGVSSHSHSSREFCPGYIHHKQHNDGYFRQHLYSSRRNIIKWSSDPTIFKKISPVSQRLSNMYYSRSLDYVPYSGEYMSRSPSPTASSDIDSFRDNPLPMYIGADSVSIDTLEDSMEQRSVMSGGTVRGWLPDVSVVLWRRVLGLLGDPNDVASPQVHEQIFKYLLELHDTLIKLRNNQGVSFDNLSTPEPSDLVPPLTILVPWCFKAFTLPPQYSTGKLLACRLLCRMLVRSHDVTLPMDILAHFYKILHLGLVGHDLEVTCTLLRGCNPNFFSLDLPGSSLLALDFVFAANTVISSSEQKSLGARFEAVTLLGCLYPLITSHEMSVLQPQLKEFNVIKCTDVKDHLIHVLLKCGRKEPMWRTRSQALLSLVLFLCHDLTSEETSHKKVIDAIELILASLRVGKMVGQVASDLLLLLADFSDVILAQFRNLPIKIIQVLCLTLATVTSDLDLIGGKEGQHLTLSLLMCLCEWVMALPPESVVKPITAEQQSILQIVFKTLQLIESGTKPSPAFLKTLKVETYDVEFRIRDEPSSSGRQELVANKVGSLRRVAQTNAQVATVQLAARAIMNHIVNHLWQFPLGVGPQRLSSLVNETDDLPEFNGAEISADLFDSPYVQMFALNRSCILSLVQLPALHAPGGAATTGFKTPNSEVRVILRDLAGKFCWDASTLFAPPDDLRESQLTDSESTSPPSENDVSPPHILRTQEQAKEDMTSSILVTSSIPRDPLRRRPTGVLPTVDDSADDLDNVDDLLSYIGFTSPEVMELFGQSLNEVVSPPPTLPSEVQNEAIASVLSHRNAENEYLFQYADQSSMVCPRQEYPLTNDVSDDAFQQCRRFFDQLGFAAFDRRKSIFTLRKNERLLREVRNLDNQKCRETHKIAVIFVAAGQEDKTSILNNNNGSETFEDFVSGLGWEVELEFHSGFMGGLHRNGTTGDTAPYFATSLIEVIFHVSTRMPSDSEESRFQKMRHLGNDEVHIVWSEHWREYRRGIIPTEFCDVLIIIYPLEDDFYRIHICVKPDVPFFGPLFDGAIVNRKCLARLVRATALNASRAKRSTLPFYQHFFEERMRSLQTIIEQHSESTTFERFISDVYSPLAATQSVARNFSTSESPSTRSNLAAALLDRPSQSPQKSLQTRPTSYSVGEQSRVREKVRNALASETYIPSVNSNPPSENSSTVSASPREPTRLGPSGGRKMTLVNQLSDKVAAASGSEFSRQNTTFWATQKHREEPISPFRQHFIGSEYSLLGHPGGEPLLCLPFLSCKRKCDCRDHRSKRGIQWCRLVSASDRALCTEEGAQLDSETGLHH